MKSFVRHTLSTYLPLLLTYVVINHYEKFGIWELVENGMVAFPPFFQKKKLLFLDGVLISRFFFFSSFFCLN